MLDDSYKMQLAQAIASRRSPVFRQPMQMGMMQQPMPNQNMQTEQALQQINEQNMQAAMQDPGTSKQELAKALAGRGLTPAKDWFGVAANALEGYNIGKAQKEAKEEAEAKKKYESDARQKLAEAYASGNFAEIVKNPLLSAGDIVNLYKAQQVSQNPFGKSLTGQLAQDNYTKLIASGMEPEMAKSAAIQQAMNQASVAQGSAVPGNFGLPSKQQQAQSQPIMQQETMVPPPPPPPMQDIIGSAIQEPIDQNMPAMTGVPFIDKINAQTQAGINEAKAKANIDISKNRELERPNIESQLKSMEFMNERTNNLINEILPKISSSTAGPIGTTLKFIPGTSAKDVQAQITTINARGIFDQLQKMRQESPTGGALGSITEGELNLLGASAANLESSQSPEQLYKNLKEFQTLLNGIFNNAKSSYQNVYGKNQLTEPKSASDYLKKYGIE